MNRKLERVEEVIRMLHMEKCADTVVGSAGARGVSGGPRVRERAARVRREACAPGIPGGSSKWGPPR